MDVDSLKAELEEHLAKNPDEHAPGGFRDRFDTLVEQYKDEGDDVPKSAMETELQQILDEAEAAWNAAASPRAETPPPRAEPVERPAAPGDPIRATIDAHVNPPEPGFMMRYGLALIIALVVLAGAYYFFRR